MSKKRDTKVFRALKALVRLFYRKVEFVGTERLPDEPVIFVGNHAQLHGPLACELYFPIARYTWCAGEMMVLKEVPAYAYRDFWSKKPKYIRWLFKLASWLIAPLAAYIFNHANTIGVYHDRRILSTFKNTVNALQDGTSVVIFPEHEVPHNGILWEFQDRFIDLAQMYWRKTGKELSFVPMYVAPALKTVCLGKPIRFRPGVPLPEERRRIRDELMDAVTALARALPEHTVVPYPNISKKEYPSNTSEVSTHENSGR